MRQPKRLPKNFIRPVFFLFLLSILMTASPKIALADDSSSATVGTDSDSNPASAPYDDDEGDGETDFA